MNLSDAEFSWLLSKIIILCTSPVLLIPTILFLGYCLYKLIMGPLGTKVVSLCLIFLFCYGFFLIPPGHKPESNIPSKLTSGRIAEENRVRQRQIDLPYIRTRIDNLVGRSRNAYEERELRDLVARERELYGEPPAERPNPYAPEMSTEADRELERYNQERGANQRDLEYLSEQDRRKLDDVINSLH